MKGGAASQWVGCDEHVDHVHRGATGLIGNGTDNLRIQSMQQVHYSHKSCNMGVTMHSADVAVSKTLLARCAE